MENNYKKQFLELYEPKEGNKINIRKILKNLDVETVAIKDFIKWGKTNKLFEDGTLVKEDISYYLENWGEKRKTVIFNDYDNISLKSQSVFGGRGKKYSVTSGSVVSLDEEPIKNLDKESGDNEEIIKTQKNTIKKLERIIKNQKKHTNIILTSIEDLKENKNYKVKFEKLMKSRLYYEKELRKFYGNNNLSISVTENMGMRNMSRNIENGEIHKK
jgi:hypothetical protein